MFKSFHDMLLACGGTQGIWHVRVTRASRTEQSYCIGNCILWRGDSIKTQLQIFNNQYYWIHISILVSILFLLWYLFSQVSCGNLRHLFHQRLVTCAHDCTVGDQIRPCSGSVHVLQKKSATCNNSCFNMVPQCAPFTFIYGPVNTYKYITYYVLDRSSVSLLIYCADLSTFIPRIPALGAAWIRSAACSQAWPCWVSQIAYQKWIGMALEWPRMLEFSSFRSYLPNGFPFSFQFGLSLWNGQMRSDHLWCCICLEIPTIRMTDGLSSLRLTVRQVWVVLSSVSLFKLENATSAKWVSVDPSSLHQTNYITCCRPHWWCIWYTSCIWLHGIIL